MPDLAKRWRVKNADNALIARQSQELNLSPLLARLLVLRGFADLDSAKRYLSSSLRSDLPSPFEMKDMDRAVARIVDAIRREELIAIWGDYDVDGTTGASVLVCFLRQIGAQPVYYVPHRIDEGYGLNIEGLRRLKERGVTLVVTVDCGISNAAEVEAAAGIGLDIVVIDHHQPPAELPPAVAVVDPHRADCRFPDKGLCAAGLAFYLTIGLRSKLRDLGWFAATGDPDLRRYLDIVTLGTIADMVPLKGINRTLIRRGLVELGASTRPGVIALKDVAHIVSGEVSAGQVGFQLGPRINAAGRVDYGIKIVELLTTDSAETALRIAQELDDHNRERRAVESEVLEQALTQASTKMGGGDCYSLVLGGDGWHPGVLGIVASRIVERFYRPTVVIGIRDGMGKGSARSIPGFHMVEGFRRCAAHLEKFGGHEYAGGLSIQEENLLPFANAFETIARELLDAGDLQPVLELDAELGFPDISLVLARQLQILKPYGVGNPEPVFMSRNVEICERKAFTAGARFRFRQSGRIVGGVAFGIGDDLSVEAGAHVDVAYRVGENEWNGTSAVDLKVVGIRPTAAPV
ncbi:MAG TPA: single-stranded-DNA-specific exonuclease RecJ [Candidatus Binatia bacterium]